MKTNKKLNLSSLLAIIGFSIFNGSNAYAQTHCYSFDNPPVGTEYQVGNTINTQFADTINVLEFQTGTNLVETATVIQNDIIGAGPPSLIVRGVTVQVVPSQRAQRVTIQYAENAPPNNPQNWNLGANGELEIWSGTLADQNNLALGTLSNGGRVAVSVTEEPLAGGYWIRGQLTLESDPVYPWLPNRGISRFAFGRNTQLLVDNVCVEF